MSNFDYHVHTDLNLIEVHPSGVVQISDIAAYAQEVLSLDILTEGTVEYFDLSEMTNLNADYESACTLTGPTSEMYFARVAGSRLLHATGVPVRDD